MILNRIVSVINER